MNINTNIEKKYEGEKYICIIGGANIDLQGSSDNPLLLKDSNPGEISMSPGGVGRNIAENASRLSIPTKIFSYVGSDALGDFLIEASQRANVDVSYIKKHKSLPTRLARRTGCASGRF